MSHCLDTGSERTFPRTDPSCFTWYRVKRDFGETKGSWASYCPPGEVQGPRGETSKNEVLSRFVTWGLEVHTGGTEGTVSRTREEKCDGVSSTAFTDPHHYDPT